MFYKLLKVYARLAIRIYCRKIIIHPPDILQSEGPLLLACNHPNSFLDGIIITTLFQNPVHSLARGDAFKNSLVRKFLFSIQLLPVYRTSEGVENLEHNYTTFAACIETFREKGIVLIFSEGLCKNEWHLRPLKKGTARLSLSAWNQGIPLTVIPTAINYSSFKRFGKEVHLFFGNAINREKILQENGEGKQYLAFNNELEAELGNMVYEMEAGDDNRRKDLFSIRITSLALILLLPAVVGFIAHLPLFILVRLASWRFRNGVHFDSVQTSILLILYPFYWFGLSILAFLASPLAGLASLIFLPFTAWAAVQLKYQLDI